MGWVKSTGFLCSVLYTVTKNAKGYAPDPSSYFSIYYPMAGEYKTAKDLTASPGSLQYVDIYMDDLLCSTQGYPYQQQRVLDLTIRELKKIPPSLPDEVKDSSILKKALSWDGDWARVKEILGWAIGTQQGTLSLYSKRQLYIISLLAIPTT